MPTPPLPREKLEEALAVLEVHGGNQSQAAEALGIARGTLQNRLRHARKMLAWRGHAPDAPNFDLDGRVPPGFVLRGQSAFVDKDGNVRQRWDKTRQEGMDPDDARKLPDPKKTVKLSTLTDAEGRIVQQWVAEKPEDIAREAAWRAFAEELAKDIPRVEPVPPPEHVASNLLAGYPIADHHLGMLSWRRETGADYDLQIGERLLYGAMSYLTRAAGPAEQALVAFMGDFMHYDSFEAVTPTNRNMLDSDTRYPKMIQSAVRAARAVIDMARRQHGRVHVIVEPGNHDLASSVFMALCLSVAYENEPRVTVDQSPTHYHYFRFGKVLVGTHHGHGTKMQNLPLIMATDRPADWGETGHRYWWTGHIHHDTTMDLNGVKVESFRTLAQADAWHAQKGYRPARDMRSIVFHAEHGEVARHTVNPMMLEQPL